ncbi:hypothetical protein LSAT2_004404, partial [Lamellibrachia satsuma]
PSTCQYNRSLQPFTSFHESLWPKSPAFHPLPRVTMVAVSNLPPPFTCHCSRSLQPSTLSCVTMAAVSNLPPPSTCHYGRSLQPSTSFHESLWPQSPTFHLLPHVTMAAVSNLPPIPQVTMVAVSNLPPIPQVIMVAVSNLPPPSTCHYGRSLQPSTSFYMSLWPQSPIFHPVHKSLWSQSPTFHPFHKSLWSQSPTFHLLPRVTMAGVSNLPPPSTCHYGRSLQSSTQST